jgi:hypothetical protein
MMKAVEWRLMRGSSGGRGMVVGDEVDQAMLEIELEEV